MPDIGQEIGQLAEGVARLVFSPDYYTRPWWIRVWTGRGWVRREVRDYQTARAWANVLAWRWARLGFTRAQTWGWFEHGPITQVEG